MRHFPHTYGPYAVVTGASAGIGEAFAEQLASRGVQLFLVARRRDKLEALAARLRTEHHVDVRCLALDLAQPGAARALFEQTQDVDVGLLVLNAAVLNVGGFLTSTLEEESQLVRLNVLAPTEVAHLVGRRLKERGRGGIVLVSSVAAVAPAPYQATYAASKAYLTSLGRALGFELAQHGVDVTVVAPGPTDTEGLRNAANIDFSKMPGAKMSPTEVAVAALDGLGRRSFVIPGLANRITALLFALLPTRVLVRLYGRMMRGVVKKQAL